MDLFLWPCHICTHTLEQGSDVCRPSAICKHYGPGLEAPNKTFCWVGSRAQNQNRNPFRGLHWALNQMFSSNFSPKLRNKTVGNKLKIKSKKLHKSIFVLNIYMDKPMVPQLYGTTVGSNYWI